MNMQMSRGLAVNLDKAMAGGTPANPAPLVLEEALEVRLEQ
jgi:hypothetical protein